MRCLSGLALLALLTFGVSYLHADTIPPSDPDMLGSDPSCTSQPTGCPNVVNGDTMAFFTSPNGGGIFDFTNGSGSLWKTFEWGTQQLFDPSQVNCKTTAFGSCIVTEFIELSPFHYNVCTAPDGVTVCTLETLSTDFGNETVMFFGEQGCGGSGIQNCGINNNEIWVTNVNGSTPDEIGEGGNTGGWGPNNYFLGIANGCGGGDTPCPLDFSTQPVLTIGEVPEPGSMVLLGSGLAWIISRRRKHQ